jgi:hypothetical protein
MVSTNNSRERGPLPRRFLGRLRRLPAPVWTLATIFGVAGVMCLFAAAFPISKTAPRELATIVGACLIVASLVLLRFGARLPQVGLQGLAIGGTLVNALLVSQATTSYGATLNSMAWIWVAIYAGQFFDQRAVRIQVAVIGGASAAALAICGVPGLLTAWVLVAGSCILAGETLARLNTRLRTQLVTDPLTGLLNRAGFGEAAERLLALAAREDLPVSVALIDLDGFKQVNDLKGHAAGDELLVELGRAWRASCAAPRCWRASAATSSHWSSSPTVTLPSTRWDGCAKPHRSAGAPAWSSGGVSRSNWRWRAPTRISTGPSARRVTRSPHLPSLVSGRPPDQRQRRSPASGRHRAAPGRDRDLEVPGRGPGEGARGESGGGPAGRPHRPRR